MRTHVYRKRKKKQELYSAVLEAYSELLPHKKPDEVKAAAMEFMKAHTRIIEAPTRPFREFVIHDICRNYKLKDYC